MATVNKSFVAKNGIEPGSNNTVDLGTSTNQFKNTYSNSVVITGGVANSTSVLLYANGYANLTTIVASNVSVTNFESVTVTITEIDANTVTAEGTTTNTLSFASANQSPNVNITVSGDMSGTATAELTNLVTDANVALSLALNANQSFDYIASNTQFVNNYIDLNPIDHPAHNEGRIFYDNVHKTLNYYSDITNLNMELGTNEYIRVYNDTGNTIPNGAALYLSGYTSTDPVVPKAVLADATSAATYNTSGLAAASIPNGSYGYCAVSGVVRGSDSDPFDTSYLTAGQRAFVSATVPGQLQQPAPSYPNYPMCMGLVVIADANNGVFVVEQQMHAVPQFRVGGDVYVGQDLTVGGNFTVLGSETVVSLTNISVDDTFFYLGSGDTISNTEFVPADANTPGLNDALYSGYYEGTTTKTFSVRIDSTGIPDTFEWSVDNFATTEANNVPITGSVQVLGENIKITFSAVTGHTLGDRWDGDASPADLDFGIISNYSNSSLYSHAGFFRDATDGKFRFFKRYDPEIEGYVDITNSSFQYADLQVNSIIGHTFTGNVTGTVTGIVTDISNHDTDDLVEGNTNLYYLTSRANTDIDARVTKTFVDALNVDAQTVFGNTAADLLNFNNFTNLPSPNVSITVTGDVEGSATADLTNLNTDASLSLSLELADTGVVANTYGSGSAIPVITIDVDGRITNASIVSVTSVTNTSTSNAVLGGNTVTFTRADSSTFDVDLADFRDYNSLINTPATPANTSTSSASWNRSNNTVTFTRADSSTFKVTGPFLPPSVSVQNTTSFAYAIGANSIAIGASSRAGEFSGNSVVIGAGAQSNSSHSVIIGHNTSFNSLGTFTSSVAIGANIAGTNGSYSVVVGANAYVSNTSSVVIGQDARANSGGLSVVVGRSASVDSNGKVFSNGVAVGHQSRARDAGSTTVGAYSVATAGNTTAIGYYAAAGDPNSSANVDAGPHGSVVIGARANVGMGSVNTVAIGHFSNVAASSGNSTVLGAYAKSNANNGIAIGHNSNAAFANSIAIGASVVTTAVNEIRLGAAGSYVALPGRLTANASFGTSGYVLKSGGSSTNVYWDAVTIPSNTSTTSAAWADANNTLTFTRADASTFDVGISFAEYLTSSDIAAFITANDLPANTSTSNATWTSANSTIDFTRVDSSTFNVTLSSVNAAALGGLSSSQFLRSDANDTTSGDLTINGNTTANNISTEGNVYITDTNKLHIGGDSSNVVAYMEFNSSQNSIDWVVI